MAATHVGGCAEQGGGRPAGALRARDEIASLIMDFSDPIRATARLGLEQPFGLGHSAQDDRT